MNDRCNTCAHKDGLWNDPMCLHKDYCNECIHSASHRKDHYTPANRGNDWDEYQRLKKKFES